MTQITAAMRNVMKLTERKTPMLLNSGIGVFSFIISKKALEKVRKIGQANALAGLQ